MNRAAFFDLIRADPFGGMLLQDQVAGIVAILDGWERLLPHGDPRWLAYALATSFHETARTMQPIEEFGKGAGHAYGDPDPVTGQAYYGRGLCQLTHKDNYRRAGRLIGADLVNHPEDALESDNAVAVLLLGMEHGLFTGKAFVDYFNADDELWREARRIVNGLDRADKIAGYGRAFWAAARAAG